MLLSTNVLEQLKAEIDFKNNIVKLPNSRVPFQRNPSSNKSMPEAGVISPSTSPWSSAVVLITKKDVYPIPRIDQLIENFNNAKYFTSYIIYVKNLD